MVMAGIARGRADLGLGPCQKDGTAAGFLCGGGWFAVGPCRRRRTSGTTEVRSSEREVRGVRRAKRRHQGCRRLAGRGRSRYSRCKTKTGVGRRRCLMGNSRRRCPLRLLRWSQSKEEEQGSPEVAGERREWPEYVGGGVSRK